jgi:hypothetical protein
MITQQTVKRWLSYSPETGKIIWKRDRNNRIKAGRLAGNWNNRGYLVIGLENKKYVASRLIWLYIHGQWPVNEIDHINRDKRDNRLVNLRDVTHAQNSFNRENWGGRPYRVHSRL